MRAVRFHGREDIRLDVVEDPECGASQVKIRPAFVGICGSDLHEFSHGPLAVPLEPHPITGSKLPTILGHEFSGTIEKVGEKVTGLKAGDRVVVNPTIRDGSCTRCTAGRYNCCEKLGFVGYSSPAGGMSDHVVVSQDKIVPLPDSIPLDIGALVEPLAVAWHAVSRAPLKGCDSALVVGAGPIGLAVVQVLKAMDIPNIIVVEISEQRQLFARAFGATQVLDPTKGSVLAEIRELSGNKGVPIAFECSGVQKGLDTATAGIQARGTTIIVSLLPMSAAFNPIDILLSEKNITGAAVYEDDDFNKVIEAIESGKIQPRSMITSKIRMDEVVEKGFKPLIFEKDKHVKILVDVSQQT